MKRRIKGWLKIGLLFTILAGLMSCEMIVDYEFPDQDPKVVVHSFISPGDTLVMVMLTWSKPITRGGFEFEPDFIGNAVVKISEEGGAPANLVYDNTRKLYVIPAAQFPVKEGKQYHLLVQVPGQDAVQPSEKRYGVIAGRAPSVAVAYERQGCRQRQHRREPQHDPELSSLRSHQHRTGQAHHSDMYDPAGEAQIEQIIQLPSRRGGEYPIHGHLVRPPSPPLQVYPLHLSLPQ